MADPKPLTRNQIARIVGNDPEAIKAFERLFTVAGQLTPADIAALTVLIETASFDAGVAQNKSEAYQPNFQKLDYIDFNRVGPHVAAARRMQWNEDDGTIDVGMNANVMLQVGQETHYYAKNTSGGDILNGTPVMFTGTLGASGKLTFGKAVADGSFPAIYMMGVATEDIPNNGFGYITSFGKVRGFNTSGTPYGETWNDGDVIYFSPSAPGSWTNVRPTAPNLDLPVAVVLNAATGGSGEIFVRMKTGESINSLHDVEAPTPSNGMVLIYDAVQGRWEANTLTAGSNITITNTAGNISVAVSGLGTMAFENTGASGSFTAASGETITVTNGIITSIV